MCLKWSRSSRARIRGRALRAQRLPLHVHEFRHAAAVDQACQFIVGGEVADLFQRAGEGLLLPHQPPADVLQPDRDEGAADEHEHDHGRVGQLQGRLAVRIVHRGHGGEGGGEHAQGEEHVRRQLAW